jgi:hypothetical protein
MERYWLSWRTPPGSTLTTIAGHAGFIHREVLECIRFCAEFRHAGSAKCVLLADCYKSPLSVDEGKMLPTPASALSSKIDLGNPKKHSI